jgi:hypothetical protein
VVLLVDKIEIERMKAEGNVNKLILALKDFDAAIRFDSASALGSMGDSTAVEPLIVALKDNDSNVRRIATEALGELRDNRAVNPLITTLRDINKAVQRSAVKALGDIGDPKAVEPLILISKDKDRLVRAQAVRALGDIGDPVAIETLENMTNDEDEVDDITIGDIAKENIVKIKSSLTYINFLKEKAKKLEKAKRHSEAVQVQNELETWEKAARSVIPPPQKEKGQTDGKVEGKRTEMLEEYVCRKVDEDAGEEPFNNCPFCGKKFSLKKTPKFCPYCNEELA